MQNIKEYVTEKKQRLKELASKSDFTAKDYCAYIVQVGNVPASERYVRNKLKDFEELGIRCELYHLEGEVSEETLLKTLELLNNSWCVIGYLVQLPLPKHISEAKVKLAIAPEKDLDGFHPLSKTVPCTPLGIYNYLKDMNFKFSGKNAVVVGRSDIVGRPMAKLLLDASMNVTVIHSKTSEEDKARFIKDADLIVVATGHVNTLTKSYQYKDSAVVIDVGINVQEDGKLIGDCERELPVAFQSPVPGGVGLLTRISIVDNLFDLYKAHCASKN